MQLTSSRPICPANVAVLVLDAAKRRRVVHQVHLVDGQHDVADAQQRHEIAVPPRLRQHALAGIDQQDGGVGGRSAGDHVARVLLVAGRVGHDERPRVGGEVAIRHVDRDLLLALGGQAVQQQREVQAAVLGAEPLREAAEMAACRDGRPSGRGGPSRNWPLPVEYSITGRSLAHDFPHDVDALGLEALQVHEAHGPVPWPSAAADAGDARAALDVSRRRAWDTRRTFVDGTLHSGKRISDSGRPLCGRARAEPRRRGGRRRECERLTRVPPLPRSCHRKQKIRPGRGDVGPA